MSPGDAHGPDWAPSALSQSQLTPSYRAQRGSGRPANHSSRLLITHSEGQGDRPIIAHLLIAHSEGQGDRPIITHLLIAHSEGQGDRPITAHLLIVHSEGQGDRPIRAHLLIVHSEGQADRPMAGLLTPCKPTPWQGLDTLGEG
ncbi:hypothetical protein ANANG_G00297370, partial [Anguilla anguilla]